MAHNCKAHHLLFEIFWSSRQQSSLKYSFDRWFQQLLGCRFETFGISSIFFLFYNTIPTLKYKGVANEWEISSSDQYNLAEIIFLWPSSIYAILTNETSPSSCKWCINHFTLYKDFSHNNIPQSFCYHATFTWEKTCPIQHGWGKSCSKTVVE